MTDFDPNKKIGGVPFNQQQGKGSEQPPAESAAEEAPAFDPYADLKINPDELMRLMGRQARLQAAQIGYPSIEQSMARFEALVSPEQHATLLADEQNRAAEAIRNEFGRANRLLSGALAQNRLDDALIGQPSIAL